MRVGLVILPEYRWSEATAMWRDAEAMGFDHLWTYDHLGWRSLVDEPWFDAIATLAAAAGVTDRVPLGTLVTSPNTRRVPSLIRETISVDDVSGGRFRLGLGSGGTDNYDNDVFGDPELPSGDRTRQFEEFVEALDRCLRSPRAEYRGDHVQAFDTRSTPGCLQKPRVPFVVGALGPRAMRVAATHGQAWVTTGWAGTDDDKFWSGVTDLAEGFDAVLAAAHREPSDIDRMLLLDAAAPTYSLSSQAVFEEQVGRADELGFTDVVVHRPRVDGIYAGEVAVMETVASDVLPRLRAGATGQA